jgi:VIT1/CCC1 family predicted Fe2+/Mn2+ transporter
MLALERRELAESPRAEITELARIYESKGLQPGLARHVAERLTARDALAAHAEAELGIDPEQLAHPGHAAWASLVSFMGAIAMGVTYGIGTLIAATGL